MFTEPKLHIHIHSQDVFHLYSVPTILQVVTPFYFLEKVIFCSPLQYRSALVVARMRNIQDCDSSSYATFIDLKYPTTLQEYKLVKKNSKNPSCYELQYNLPQLSKLWHSVLHPHNLSNQKRAFRLPHCLASL